jgi:hypothetical protein
MAQAVLTRPQYARIWINATAPNVPGVAKKLCAINSKAFNQSVTTGTALIPDCADVTKVSFLKRTPISKDWSITGSGYMEMSLRNDLQTILDGAASVNIVFEINDPETAPATPTDGYYAGKAFLEQFNIVANNNESYITVDLTFTADGPATWTSTTIAPPEVP